MCTYFVLNKYYYINILYGGSHASDILDLGPTCLNGSLRGKTDHI